MNQRLFMLAMAALLAMAGLALKTQRYAHQFTDRRAEERQQLTAFLARQGWHAIANGMAARPFEFTTFAKSGCAGELIVAMLGTSRELVDDAKLALGADTGIVQTAPTPTGWAALTGSRSGLGLLAVSPAPGQGVNPCQSATGELWRTISLEASPG